MSSAPEKAIFDLAKEFATINDVDVLLSKISRSVESLTGSEASSILLLDDDRQNLVFRVASGEKGASMKKFYVPLGKGVAGWVAEKEEAVIINDVQSDTRFTGKIDKSSGFSTRSILAVPMLANGEMIGVAEALNKNGAGYTDSDKNILESLSALAAASIVNARMAQDQRNFFSHMMEIVALAVEGGDSKQTGHSYRVAEQACRIGRQLGIKGDDYKRLYYAAILHDIGMIATHDLKHLPNILSQTIERTPDKLHPLVGAELIKNIRLLAGVDTIIRHHHEFFDGSGHPDGLVGADIPIESRIIGLIEQIDEIHMQGITGDAFVKRALDVARKGAGSKFDPEVVEAFMATLTP